MFGAYALNCFNADNCSEHKKRIAELRYSSFSDVRTSITAPYSLPTIKNTYHVFLQRFNFIDGWISPIYTRNIINILVHNAGIDYSF